MDAFWGVLMGGGFLWGMAYAYYLLTKQEGMGGGDIKLLAWIGALLGWKAIPFVIMTSAVVGSIVGLVMARKQDAGLKTVIPFGPYLALGAVLYLFGGEAIALWYLDLFLPALS
jgi:leader peptidase (prepilin peptidase)/N-methyltransferase